jgi:hypothetical protein
VHKNFNVVARNFVGYLTVSFLLSWLLGGDLIKAIFFAILFSILMVSVGEWLFKLKIK